MADMRTVAAPTAMLFTLGLVCFTEPGFAQQPDTSAQRPDSTLSAEALKKLSIEQLMNLQVTSVSKRPERLSQTASAIQVITRDDMRRSGASSLPEVLRLATNLQVAQVDARQWAISARGFNSTTANKLLVLIDGRTVYTPLFSGVFWDVQEVPLTDVDRIEVISGPGATLWGANAVNGVINVITQGAKQTQGLLLSGGGGTEQRAFGTVRYGGALGSSVRYRIYGRGFGREATALPSGQDAADDWHLGQGGFRMDWDASNVNRVTLQGDLYDGRIAQRSAGDITVGGGNVMAKWSYTISDRSSLAAQLYYDRTHRHIPGTFGEDLDTYDVDLQHRARLGVRHDVVWGLGYRLSNDRVANSSALAFLPPQVARQWFTGFVQDEIALVPNRLHVALGSKIEHNDYTGFEIQPSGRVNWGLSPSGTLWAAVSRALRTPSRIDRELFAPAQPPYFLAGGPPSAGVSSPLCGDVLQPLLRAPQSGAGQPACSLPPRHRQRAGRRVLRSGGDGRVLAHQPVADAGRLHRAARSRLAQARQHRHVPGRGGVPHSRSPVLSAIVSRSAGTPGIRRRVPCDR
ncbi:MAG: hypothetical protein E6J45_13170 [Chloroflexi bacterium]|nr:MAG: hypothetical protein E6J45_13170 [Chloroflexota bacterium]